MDGTGTIGRRESGLAGPRTSHWSHASAPGALRRNGLADPGRCDLRHGTALRRRRAATARPRDCHTALQKTRADPRDRPGTAAHAQAPFGMRMAGRARNRCAGARAKQGSCESVKVPGDDSTSGISLLIVTVAIAGLWCVTVSPVAARRLVTPFHQPLE